MSLETNLKMMGFPSDQIPVDQFHCISEIDPEVLSKALNNLQSVVGRLVGECREHS